MASESIRDEPAISRIQLLTPQEQHFVLSKLEQIYDVIQFEENSTRNVSNTDYQASNTKSQCGSGVRCLQCPRDSLFCVTDETFGMLGFSVVLAVYAGGM